MRRLAALARDLALLGSVHRGESAILFCHANLLITLFRRTRDVLGVSPSDLIRQARLQRGATLLTSSSDTVAEIARSEAQGTRWGRVALWVIAIVVVTAAARLLLWA